MVDVIVLDADDDGGVGNGTPPPTFWRPRYLREKEARKKAEAQTVRLQAENSQVRREAACMQTELQSTKAAMRRLQSAKDVLETELAQLTASAQEIAHKWQAEQEVVARLKEETDITMAETKRLGQELAIAMGANAQLQKERAVRMEALAQVTAVARGLRAAAGLAQACLDAARDERQMPPHHKLGQHGSSLIAGCEFISPPASPREKGTAEGANFPAAAMNRSRSPTMISAPGASAFNRDRPGDAVGTAESSKAATREALYFSTPYVFQRGKPGKGTDGVRLSLPCDDALVASRTTVVVCDGVSAGGSQSGDLARAVATAAHSRAEDCTGRIADAFRSPLQNSAVSNILDRSPQASTTVTMLKIHNPGEEGNDAKKCSFIEAIEVGDSQWALLRRGEDNVWSCRYISAPHMYLDQPRCPLQFGATHDVDFFLGNMASGSSVCQLVPVEQGDIVIAASDGMWDNFNDAVGLLSRDQMKEKLVEFFKSNYGWWASNNSDKEPFVSFVGKRIKDAVIQRMSGPQTSSITNRITRKHDDVTFFVGAINALGQESSLGDDCHQSPDRWLFASDKVDHMRISDGIEYDCTTTKKYVEQALAQGMPEREVDRFEGYKVDMCRNARNCHFGARCIYAHHEEELRCKFWTRNTCHAGDKCPRKHGTANLQVAREALDQFTKCKAKRGRAEFQESADACVAKRAKFSPKR